MLKMEVPCSPLEDLLPHNPLLAAPFQLLDIQAEHIAELTRYGIVERALQAGSCRLPKAIGHALVPENTVMHMAIGRRLDQRGRPLSSCLYVTGPYFSGDEEYNAEVFINIVDYPMEGVMQEHEPFNEDEARLVHQLAEELANSGIPGLNPNLVDFDWLGHPPNASGDTW